MWAEQVQTCFSAINTDMLDKIRQQQNKTKQKIKPSRKQKKRTQRRCNRKKNTIHRRKLRKQ